VSSYFTLFGTGMGLTVMLILIALSYLNCRRADGPSNSQPQGHCSGSGCCSSTNGPRISLYPGCFSISGFSHESTQTPAVRKGPMRNSQSDIVPTVRSSKC
jgi:hypothetical protein